MPLHQNVYFHLFSELMISIVILNILPVSLLFIQESFQVLESDVHRVNKKIHNSRSETCLLFSPAPDIRKVRLGRKVGVTISRQ